MAGSRFFITDTVDGKILRTDNAATALEFASCEDFFVVDAETDEQILSDGTRKPIAKVAG